MPIDELRTLLGDHGAPSPAATWDEAEAVLGLTFPDEYKRWCATYPTITIDEYVTVYNLLDMPPEREREESVGTFDGMRDYCATRGRSGVHQADGTWFHDPAAPAFHPEPGGLLAWGVSDNNDLFMWRTDNWTVVVSDGVYWWESGAGFADTLAGLLSGRVRCPVIDDEFPWGETVQVIRRSLGPVGERLWAWEDPRPWAAV